MEKVLREYLIYTGQVLFYEDMMKERRVIRQARLLAAKRKAEKRAFILNTIAVLIGMCIASLLVTGVFLILFT